ncbi:hypothetical protein [Polaromonas sp. JS666]|uniref:hypothetical protein n=1 Tax=Polaromonas sp. (strain JS666 / ATCC BAA-500) TaxID=296591 RepID=UPI0000537B6E|nr:hypothetical protein [Polaromonas sp. JS666]ABE43259.1 hypothetical protein Bpro_1309 [Polaromonas sp. JS666]
MAYSSSSNPARQIMSFDLSGGGGVFAYQSTHSHSEIEAPNFFTGAGRGSLSTAHGACIGLRVGDLLVHASVSTAGSSAVTWHRVSSLSTSTGFAGPISATVSVASS